ncbi:hypothetical protein ACLB2K_054378 [Fragaria x ananassa]
MPAIPPIETPTPAEPPTAVMCRIDLVASPSPIWLWDSNVHNTSQTSGTRAVLVFSTAVISLHKQNCSSGRGSGSVTSSPSHQWLMRWSNHRGPAMFFGAALESEEMKPFLSLNNDHPHHFTFHTNHLDFKTATTRPSHVKSLAQLRRTRSFMILHIHGKSVRSTATLVPDTSL